MKDIKATICMNTRTRPTKAVAVKRGVPSEYFRDNLCFLTTRANYLDVVTIMGDGTFFGEAYMGMPRCIFSPELYKELERILKDE